MVLPSHLPLVIEMSVSAIGNKSYTQDYRIIDDDESVAATARVVMVLFDDVTGQAVLIPEYIREWMSQYT